MSKRIINANSSFRCPWDGVLRGGEMRNADNVHVSSLSILEIDWWCWWPGIEYRATFVGTIASPVLILLLAE